MTNSLLLGKGKENQEAQSKEQAMELGKRAVACKHWRWMIGMRAIKQEIGQTLYLTSKTMRPRAVCSRWLERHGQQLRQAPIITGAMTRSEGIITFGLAIIAQAHLGSRL
jgi:hypothetical protein